MVWIDEEQFADGKLVIVDFAALRVNKTNLLRHLYQPARQNTQLIASSQTYVYMLSLILLLLLQTFNRPLSRTTRVSRYQKGKTNLDLLKQETVSGSGISWAICKSAPRSRQITTPAPHSSVFTGQMPFLPPNQQRQSTEGNTNTSSLNP